MSTAGPIPTPHPLGAWRGAARALNALVLPLAGTRLMPLYGVVEHLGRRSGKTYRTPVVVKSTDDGFLVPMPWGEGTDWYRNVRAAGGCAIRWRGREYPVGQPELVERAAAARAGLSAVERALMGLFGIKRFLRLRHRHPPGQTSQLPQPS